MKRIGLILMAILLVAFPMFSQIINLPADQTTIQEAINKAGDGDTVLVAERSYIENINFRGKAITVASQFLLDNDTSHISKTTIDGSQATNPDTASVVTLWSGEDTTSVLIGFTITGGSGTLIVNASANWDRLGVAGIITGIIVRNKIIKSNNHEKVSE